ncbi:MAG: hypothetical protein D6732_13990 [Methanobacteriota archaeon]|nr:MAG: hypothetical protein D6732_13990 [Euryarchaeota archaeon]
MSSQLKIAALEQPQKLFLILLFVFIWFQILSLVGTVLLGQQNNLPFDPIAFSLLLVVVVGSIISFFAIFNNKPPFHNFIYISLIANTILALTEPGGIDVINLLYSFLLFYLFFRYPFELVPSTFRLPQPTHPPSRKKKKQKRRR